MAFADLLKNGAARLHAVADEDAHYQRDGGLCVKTKVLFRPITVNDLVSEHVMADDSICEILEANFNSFMFTKPRRGDVVIRNLYTDNEQWEVIEYRHNRMAGNYVVFVRNNIRLIP